MPPIVLAMLLALGQEPVTAVAAKQPALRVIAHRGASGYLPEHTLEAVALAHGLGADFIEQDLVLSKDHALVVLHDVEIDAVTDVARAFPDRKRPDGRYYAIDFTLAELKTLTVHERTNPRTGKPAFPKRFPQGRGTFRIPTLDEEIDLIEGLNASTGRKVGIYPEIKSPAWHRKAGHDISPIVLQALKKRGYSTKADNFYLQCFDFDEVARIRSELKFPGKLVQLLGGRRTPHGDLFEPATLAALARHVDGLGPGLPLVVRTTDGTIEPTPLVELAHKAGLEVHPYTLRTDALPRDVALPDLLKTLNHPKHPIDALFADQPDRAR